MKVAEKTETLLTLGTQAFKLISNSRKLLIKPLQLALFKLPIYSEAIQKCQSDDMPGQALLLL